MTRMTNDLHLDPGFFPNGAVFVLGGSGGLGRAVCQAFARYGQPVAFTYHSNRAAAEEVLAELTELGVEAAAYQLDASNREAVFATVAEAAKRFEKLHSAVYAGGPAFKPQFFSTTPAVTWHEWLHADVMGGINLAQAALPFLRLTHGAFVTLSTYQNNKIELRGSVSTISKAALDRMVAAIAKEEGRYGVRANAVRVGWIDVKGPQQLIAGIPGLLEEKVSAIPLGRLGTPQELGEAVAFLASRRAGFISGTTLTVDGGESV